MKGNIKTVEAPARQEPHTPSKDDIARAIIAKREHFTHDFACSLAYGASLTTEEGVELVDTAIAMADRVLERLYHVTPEQKEEGKK